jgi:hypothetical protein
MRQTGLRLPVVDVEAAGDSPEGDGGVEATTTQVGNWGGHVTSAADDDAEMMLTIAISVNTAIAAAGPRVWISMCGPGEPVMCG